MQIQRPPITIGALVLFVIIMLLAVYMSPTDVYESCERGETKYKMICTDLAIHPKD